MAPLVFELADNFYSALSKSESGVEPILIADRVSSASHGRLFLVRYILGEGAGGESRRPVFKNELTAYDYDMQLAYPTQKGRP